MPKSLKLKLDIKATPGYNLSIPKKRDYVVSGSDATFIVTAEALGYTGNTTVVLTGTDSSNISYTPSDGVIGPGEQVTIAVDTSGWSEGVSDLTVSANELVSENLRINWTPGVNVGVPGGIPNRTTIGATVDASTYGTGLIDASGAIDAAIDACSDDCVVYIPEGIYRLDNRISHSSTNKITIRGDGKGKTILKSNISDTMFNLGNGDWPRPSGGIAIIGGATKGSTVLTVADAASITVGNLVRVEQNDLSYVIRTGVPTNNKIMSAMFRVTTKTSTTVTITPALPFTFTQNPTLVLYTIAPITFTGIEDMTLDCNSLSPIGITITQSWGCWVKNVEIKSSTNRQMLLYWFVSGDIRQNYTHSVIGGGSNHEGIDLYEDSCYNLIEDNVTYNGGYPGIILGDSRGGCTGNVIAYNFCYHDQPAYPLSPEFAVPDISVSHGAHNMMNLVEGNICGGFISDGYYGSTSHITVVRNWFTATHPIATDNLIAFAACRWNNYFNVVGNILGTSSFSGSGLYQPDTTFSYSTQVIYKLGFPNLGNNNYSLTWGPNNPPDYTSQAEHQSGPDSLQELDLNVKNTMLRHGNFDYKNNSIMWDSSTADHLIPDSYYREVKPTFFGSLAWPPFDPASPPGYFDNTSLCLIPAGYRYVHDAIP